MNRAWPYPHKHGLSDNHTRGTKRSRPPPSSRQENQSDQSDHNNDDDDVDVPLSKRINRLNIEYTKQKDEQETFKEKYPYDPSSTYYQTNEALYNLHKERAQRSQQAALHKALNSHLKL